MGEPIDPIRPTPESTPRRPKAGKAELSGEATRTVPLCNAEKLLIDMGDLACLTSLSVRHLRRLDSSGDIPGRVACGRRVLFQTEIIRDWVRAGLPGRDQWTALQRAASRPGGSPHQP